MKKIVVTVLAVLVIVASVLTLTACNKDNSKDYEYVTDKGTLIIGITNFEPMNYKEDGKWIGFDTEFAQAVCDEMGLKADFQEIDWDTKEFELNAKTIDCIWNGFTVNDERKKDVDFTISYMMNEQAVVIDAKNADKYTTLESLKSAKIASEGGSAGVKAIEEDDFLKQAELISVAVQTDCLIELKAGTSDAAVMDYVMAKSYVGKGAYADLVIVEDISLAYEEYAIGFRKGSNLDEKINEVIVKLYKDGTLTKIAQKYDIEVQLLDLSK